MRRPAARPKRVTYENHFREHKRLSMRYNRFKRSYEEKYAGFGRNGPKPKASEKAMMEKVKSAYYKSARDLQKRSLAESYRKLPSMTGIKTKAQATRLYRILDKRLSIMGRNMNQKVVAGTSRDLRHMSKLEYARGQALRKMESFR